MKTAERPSSSGDGKRTRSEPDSCRRPRRVTPSSQRTSKRTAPRARLAAKIAEAAPVSVRILPPEAARCRITIRSQRHLAADLAGIEACAVAGVLHRAPIHDSEIVAELAGKVEILFDQHDGDVAEVTQIRDGAADVLDDRGLDAFGRLVEQQQSRAHHQRAADGELLLLAAGEIAAAAAEHALQYRKQRKHVVGDAALIALQGTEAGLEIFLHRQQRKDL